jgi:uncharacterized protein
MLLADPARAQSESLRVWIVGDSTVAPLAMGLEYVLKERELDVPAVSAARAFKLRSLFRTSSGLARPDFFDWPAAANTALAQAVPDVAILCVGANDTQPLLPPGKPVNVALHTPEWKAEYTRRLEAFARLFTARSVRVYFMLPSFELELKYADTMQEITDCMRATAETVGARILDGQGMLLGEDGQPRKSMVNARGKTVALRSADRLHLSGYGGVILARQVLQQLNEDLGQKDAPAKGAASVQMTLK